MKDFIRTNWVVLTFAGLTMLCESMHHLPMFHVEHSTAKYRVGDEVILIPIAWSSVIYYFMAQLGKASLFGSFVAFKYARAKRLKDSQPIAFSLVIACGLWQVDEMMNMARVDTSVLFFDSSVIKLLFVGAATVATYLIYKRVQCRRPKSPSPSP